MRVRIGQHTEAGRKAINQDFHAACIPQAAPLAAKGVVLALADGIGSSRVSRVASEAAVRAAVEDYYCTSDAWSVKRSMQAVLGAINAWLHAQTQRSAMRHDQDRGYVCALAALVLKGRTAHLFHAGDVRVVRMQGGTLEQLTEDHRVWIGGGQSQLSRAIGFRPALELDYRTLPLAAGDVFLLACDGVHEHLPATAMADILQRHGDDPDAAARALVARALAAGSEDNLTAQVVRVDALPPPDAPEALQLREGLAPAPLLAPREVFDGYRIERELHGSSRSHVYLATDLETGARVALKVPSVNLGGDAAYLDRLMLEEWIARRLRSPHVLRAHERTRPRSHLYLAMEYVDGRTLAQCLRDHPVVDIERVRDIVEQVARGLQAFHRMEMVHRDLRPENILIDRSGTVKIIDFGSVRVAGLSDDGGSQPEQVLGTLQYTAPECFLGEPATARSDLFSLGVIAYQMLSGRLPYGARAARLRTRTEQARLAYTSVLDDARAIPAWLDAALAKAVHPLPHKRQAALSEFVHDLRHPPADWVARRRPALAERHPVRFWQAISLGLALLALVELALLHARA
nr:bifunctional protein-serine/threonine kinase/phosphatase [Ramlibacter ginsenosidimutans]